MTSIVLFSFVFIFAAICASSGNTLKNRKTYIFIMLTILTLESGLRGLSVGSDTANYYWIFEHHANLSWNEIWESFVDRYIEWNSDEDIGFMIYNKLLSYISSDFSVYLIICALTFFIPFGRLLTKHTKDFTQLVFIFVLYVALFNMIAMSGVRKEIALGATIAAFMCYTEKRYKYCTLYIVLGTFIHLSTLLFLLIPLLGILNLNKLRNIHFVSFFTVPIVIVFSGWIIVFMGNMVESEKFAHYGEGEAAGGGVTFMILLELISLLCFLAFSRIKASKEDFFTKLYIMLPCFTFFAPLITNNGSMIRISQYFHLYILLLLPYALDLLGGKNNRIFLYVTFEIILIIMNLSTGGGIEYKFIWEDNIPIRRVI